MILYHFEEHIFLKIDFYIVRSEIMLHQNRPTFKRELATLINAADISSLLVCLVKTHSRMET